MRRECYTVAMTQTQTYRIEQLEALYRAMGAIPDHRWGEPEEREMSRYIEQLREAYDEANVPEIDRIAL